MKSIAVRDRPVSPVVVRGVKPKGGKNPSIYPDIQVFGLKNGVFA
jgi:hypothetical protein